jgi:hypothetical protein
MNVSKKARSGDEAGAALGAAVGPDRLGLAPGKDLGAPMTWPVGRTGCGFTVARSGLEHLARKVPGWAGAGDGQGRGPGAVRGAEMCAAQFSLF